MTPTRSRVLLTLLMLGFCLGDDSWQEVTNPYPPNPDVWGVAGVAPPTNSWFTHIATKGEGLLNQFPYIVKVTKEGLELALTQQERQRSNVTYPFAECRRIIVKSPNSDPIVSVKIVSFDDLSVTFEAKTKQNGNITIPLVRGSPYISFIIKGTTVEVLGIGEDGHHKMYMLYLNGNRQDNYPRTSSADRLEIQFNTGDTWLVYSSTTVDWEHTVKGIRAKPFKGELVVRIALWDRLYFDKVLDEHAGAIPLGGQVTWLPGADNDVKIRFEYSVKYFSQCSLLMMALPHHVFTSEQKFSKNVPEKLYDTIVGPMRPRLGNIWDLVVPFPEIRWTRDIAPTFNTEIVTSLEKEELSVIDKSNKQLERSLFRLSRLAVIADQFEALKISTKAREALTPAVNQYFSRIVKDKTYGALRTSENPQYRGNLARTGRLVYAAATIAKGDSHWANSKYDAKILELIDSIAKAHPERTFVRNMDWWVGHSWDSGILQDRPRLRSSGDVITAYYSMSLYCKTIGDIKRAQLFRTLAAVEIQGMRTYIQILPESEVFHRPFTENHLTGVLRDLEVDFDTSKPELSFSEQLGSFTPISKEYLGTEWVSKTWFYIKRKILENPELTDDMRAQMLSLQAVIHSQSALAGFQKLEKFSSPDNSRTNFLYWILSWSPEPRRKK